MSPQQLSGAVVSENKLASEIGTRVLQAGGNAADAIVATIIAVNTTSPYHSDLGGGGFAIIRTKTGEFEGLNFRHCAPKAATAEFYKDASTTYGGTSVGVPGQMKGLEELHRRHGRLAWKDLFTESIALAGEGQDMRADFRQYVKEELKGTSRKGTYMENEMYSPFFDDNGEALQVGQKYQRREYARALQLVADQGAKVLHAGEIGQGIVDAVRSRGGLLTMEDLRDYKTEWYKPISAKYRGYDLWTLPAPASGAIWLNTMGILEALPTGTDGTATELHRLTEALRLAYGTRTQLGDPDFVSGLEEAQKKWISPEFAKERANMVDDNKTFEPEYYAPPKADIKVDNGTSNVTVADSDGLVISVTTTVGLPFGSRIITKHGIVLNDSMDDFSVATRPNHFGYEPSPSNYIVGGKRPLSSSCPYIVTDSLGRPILAGGAAGGSTIISGNAQVARNVLDYGMTASEAQRATRLHNQVLPNVTKIERSSEHQGIKVESYSDEQVEGLKAKGHAIEWIDQSMSTTCAIGFTYDGDKVEWDPAPEPRKHDSGGSVFRADKR